MDLLGGPKPTTAQTVSKEIISEYHLLFHPLNQVLVPDRISPNAADPKNNNHPHKYNAHSSGLQVAQSRIVLNFNVLGCGSISQWCRELF